MKKGKKNTFFGFCSTAVPIFVSNVYIYMKGVWGRGGGCMSSSWRGVACNLDLLSSTNTEKCAFPHDFQCVFAKRAVSSEGLIFLLRVLLYCRVIYTVLDGVRTACVGRGGEGEGRTFCCLP